VRQLSKCENVAVKLSGLVTEADVHRWQYGDFELYFDVILNEFGPARIMFGSDWPVCLIAADYSQVLELADQLVSALSPTERRLIFGETASRWYGVP
jgi:L-fuconolactonase